MPNLKDIRKRIASVKNTQKITSAMKMVSAAKLRRAQERAEAARPYAVKMRQVIGSLAERVDPEAHPLLQARESQDKALVIVISSDRGLCGGYNTYVFRTTDKYMRDRKVSGVDFQVATVGRKAVNYFRRTGADDWKNYPDVIGDITYKKAKAIAQDAIAAFLGGEFDNVYLVYNEFVSAIQYNTVVQPLLPLTLEDLGAQNAGGADVAGDDVEGGVASEYIFEPDEESLLKQLLPAHIEVQVLRALIEAEASEHGARMTAMDNATNNASDMISSLTLQYNRARQAYITKELVEIVSGAEALNA